RTETIIRKNKFAETIERAKPYAHVIQALHGLKRVVSRIFLVCHPSLMVEKVTWIQRQLGVDWPARVVFVADRSILRGHVFIDGGSSLDSLMHFTASAPIATAYELADWPLHVVYRPIDEPLNGASNSVEHVSEHTVASSAQYRLKDW